MTREELIHLMKIKPYLLDMGKGKLAKRYKCSQADIVYARNVVRNNSGHMPKILIFDTETAPMAGYVFERWNQNIGLEQTIHEWFMICWSAKWLNEDRVYGDVLTCDEAVNQDDSRIAKSLWTLIDEADIIVAHNCKKADEKWMNTRFILNGLNPPRPYHVVDTLRVAKDRFGFSSNKLDALAGYFGIEHKIGTDFKLWRDCLYGKQAALDYMLEYNIKDTEILEKVYLKLLPWIKNHPAINVFAEADVCPICGSRHFHIETGKYFVTSANKYFLFRCDECGGTFRGREKVNDFKPKIVKCSH